ncbi:SEC-C metal-binding domain-containing protein [Burkholderia sp. LFS061]|uniref:SEC-C metal-binding domain-containing protein n=1 Tax=Burkholderia sp. LFS061 TaxID=3229885 RepID=UPI003A8045C1
MRFQNLEDKCERPVHCTGLFRFRPGGELMAVIPAICDRCGTAFPSGFWMDGNTSGITFTGSKSGPCPKCGGVGSIPDGVYALVNGLIQFARAGGLPAERLAMLSEVATAARAQNWSREQFTDEAERRAPGAASLLSWMPENKSEWYTFIGILITVLALLQASSGYTLKDLISAGAEQPAAARSSQAPSTSNTPRALPQQARDPGMMRIGNKVGRNELCPCGSGIKFKRCHGRVT